MKAIYRADDGTEFDTSAECSAYEQRDRELFEKWERMVHKDQSTLHQELWDLVSGLCRIRFESLRDVWLHRKSFVRLAKSFLEADPTLEQSFVQLFESWIEDDPRLQEKFVLFFQSFLEADYVLQKRFVRLAESWIEADPTLKQLSD